MKTWPDLSLAIFSRWFRNWKCFGEKDSKRASPTTAHITKLLKLMAQPNLPLFAQLNIISSKYDQFWILYLFFFTMVFTFFKITFWNLKNKNKFIIYLFLNLAGFKWDFKIHVLIILYFCSWLKNNIRVHFHDSLYINLKSQNLNEWKKKKKQKLWGVFSIIPRV